MVFRHHRYQLFDPAYLQRVGRIMRDVCAGFGAELRECSGEAEHVHLLVSSPPTVAISRLVNSLSGASRRLRPEFTSLRRYPAGEMAMAGACCAGSGEGAPPLCLR